MHTVEMLEQALAVAERLGYSIRYEWLGGKGGGACEVAGRKWIFVDLALNAFEQLEQVVEAIQQDAAVHLLDLSQHEQALLGLRRAA